MLLENFSVISGALENVLKAAQRLNNNTCGLFSLPHCSSSRTPQVGQVSLQNRLPCALNENIPHRPWHLDSPHLVVLSAEA